MNEPLQDTKLTDDDIAKISAHLQKVAPEFHCAACGKDTFTIHPRLAAIPIANMTELSILGSFFPAILTSCLTCGHVDQFMPTQRLMKSLSIPKSGEPK